MSSRVIHHVGQDPSSYLAPTANRQPPTALVLLYALDLGYFLFGSPSSSTLSPTYRYYSRFANVRISGSLLVNELPTDINRRSSPSLAAPLSLSIP